MRDSQKHSSMRSFLVLLLCFACGVGFYSLSGDGSVPLAVKWLHQPVLSYGNDFSEGRAWAREEIKGPWTLLDNEGNVLKKDFEAFAIQQYEGGVARFVVYGSADIPLLGFLDRSGNVVSSPRNYGTRGGGYGDGLISQQGGNGRLGFVDLDGKWVISPDYESVWPFQEGLAAVKKEKGGKWGFIDKSGAVAIDFSFDYSSMFSHNMSVVESNAKYGVIDPQGRWIAEPIYENIANFRWSNLVALEKGGKVGFLDSQGKVAIDFRFLSQQKSRQTWVGLYCFDDGYAGVILADPKDDKKEFGIIDESGEVIFKTEETPGRVWNGFLLDQDEEGTPFLVDREGKRHSFPSDFKYPPVWITPTKDDIFTYRDEKNKRMGYFTIDQ